MWVEQGVAGEHRAAFAGVELTAYCPCRPAACVVTGCASGRVCGQRWSMSPCPPVRGLRQFRPHMHLGDVTVPDGVVGAADGGVSPAQDASLRAGLSSSGESPVG
jgi:hypothetical protein